MSFIKKEVKVLQVFTMSVIVKRAVFSTDRISGSAAGRRHHRATLVSPTVSGAGPKQILEGRETNVSSF